MKRHCGLWVGGIIGLLLERALEEAISYSGLAWASILASLEALELGGLDCVAWHRELEEVAA